MGIKYTKELEQKILNLYDSGMSASKIGKKLGKHTTAITRVLRRNNRKISDGKGPNHSQWKGGRGLKSGYWTVYAPNHPRALNINRVWEHILIMEEYLGRPITKEEHIHHIDFNRKNNKLENLYVCKRAEHMQIHGSLEKVISKLMKKGIIKFIDGYYEESMR